MRFDIVHLNLSIAEVIKDNKLDSMAKLGVQPLNMARLVVNREDVTVRKVARL